MESEQDNNEVSERSPLEVLFILASAFPACFSVKRRRPLKRGITADIVALLAEAGCGTVTATELAGALKYYTSGQGYLLQMRPGRKRIDLAGRDAGFVTADEARWAELRRTGLEDRWRAKRANRLTQKEKAQIKRSDSLAKLKKAWHARRTGGGS